VREGHRINSFQKASQPDLYITPLLFPQVQIALLAGEITVMWCST
jgi:hypothetical protein